MIIRYSFGQLNQRYSGTDVKLSTHLHQFQMLIMRKALPRTATPLPPVYLHGVVH